MLRSSLCDYSDAYIIVKGTMSIVKQTVENLNNSNKKLVFKNCAPFTDCLSEINNTQIDDAKHNDLMMPMYTLRKYSNNYSKVLASLWQYYRDEPSLDDNGNIKNFHHDGNNSVYFKLNKK